MARIYGYWDDELNQFVPAGGGAPQQQGAMPIGGNQGSYGVPYNNAPRYNQRFYGPGYAPTNVAVGFNNGPRVRYNYQPRYTGNGYAPRGYNTNMNYGPWYGQQSYATYPPYAPNQPRYEWVPGSNGQPVAVRLGEYQREQPVAYETMFNSQGVPVRVPVYAPMNNSAMPVRVGVSPNGQPYGSANVNYQAAFPQRATQQTRQRRQQVQQRSVSRPVLGEDGYVDQVSAGLVNVDNPGNTGHIAIYNPNTIEDSTNPVVSTPSASTGYDLAVDLFGKTREEMIQEEFNRIKQQPLAGDVSPLTDDEILANVTKRIDNKINKQLNRINRAQQAEDNQLFVSE